MRRKKQRRAVMRNRDNEYDLSYDELYDDEYEEESVAAVGVFDHDDDEELIEQKFDEARWRDDLARRASARNRMRQIELSKGSFRNHRLPSRTLDLDDLEEPQEN